MHTSVQYWLAKQRDDHNSYAYLAVFYRLTGTQPDVVQYSELLPIDRLQRRHSCSLSLDAVEDCQVEMMNQRWTYCTKRQHRLHEFQQNNSVNLLTAR